MSRFFMRSIPFFLVVFLFSTSVFAGSIPVSGLAGSGDAAYADGKGAKAAFNGPQGLAIDADGGLLVADSGNNRIRRIKDGTVTTIAGFCDKEDSFGYPLGGYADGEASKARFNDPRSLALDSKGSIYVSDSGNNVIRKIAGGKVYTFSGSGTAGFADGKRSTARFNDPLGMVVDVNGNIFVADSLNNVIRKISPTGDVTTFAGKYSEGGGYKDGNAADALFNEPSDVALDSKGALYVLDSGNQLVRKVDGGKVTTVAGVRGDPDPLTGYSKGGFSNGNAIEAQFNFPKGLDITQDGTILIADTWNHRVRAIRSDGKVVTVAGTGLPGNAGGELDTVEFNEPADVLYSSGVLYISDMSNNRIEAVTADTAALSGITDRNELLKQAGFTARTNDIQVWLDGKKVTFKDVKPLADKGRAYLPIRAVCEAWGARVDWDGKTRDVTIAKGGKTTVMVTAKENVLSIRGRLLMDTDRLSVVMGFRIEWYPESNAVVIVSNS